MAKTREELINEIIGSCSCGTKSNSTIFHDDNCRYRLIMEELEKLQDDRIGEIVVPNCFVCNKEFSSVFGDYHQPDMNQPNGGLSFSSQGQYGSTKFDPMDGSIIEINICDECVSERQERILFQRSRKSKLRYWKPNEES